MANRAVAAAAAFVCFFALGELTFGPAGADGQAAATVHMKGSQFSPSSVSISTGQTVQFINDDDGIAHTVTASDKSFDSGNLEAGKSWSYTFTKAGTYAYVCTYHNWMKGTVKVLEVGSTPQHHRANYDGIGAPRN